MMKILFLTLLDFYSLETHNIYTDLLKEFVNNYHSIYVVSPTERKNKKPSQLINEINCKILKVKIGNIQKTNIIEKGLTTLFLEGQILSAIKRYFKDIKFDLVLYTTPPITFSRVIEYIKERDNAKSYLLLKDIFPQNAVDLKMIKAGSIVHKYFLKKEKKLYQLSDFIGCMSPANMEYLLNNNEYFVKNKVEVCPNSIIPLPIVKDEETRASIRRKYNLPIDKTIFLYGGNLGRPQGIEFIMQCIENNEHRCDSFFLIVGSGTEFKKLETYFKRIMPKNASLFGQFPQNDFQALCNECDVGMIFLDKCFTIPNFPSRLLSYMQAAIPVVCATDKSSDIGQISEKNGFGFFCESSDIDAFNDIIEYIAGNKTLIEEMGKKSYKYLVENNTAKHSYDIIIKHFKDEGELNV